MTERIYLDFNATRPKSSSHPAGPRSLKCQSIAVVVLIRTTSAGRLGDQVVLNGHPEHRLPNTLNVSFRGMNGGEILSKLPNVAASTGSACHAGEDHLSPVLAAMGVPAEVGFGAIRFSLGRTTKQEEIDSVVEELGHVLAQ